VFYSKSEGCWVARISLGCRDGRRVRRKVRAATEREGRAQLDRLLREHRAGFDPRTGTLDAYLAEWLPAHARSIRPSTVTSYEGHIRNHIGPLLGGIELSRLRPADTRRLITDLERKGLSPGTVHLVIRTLSAALSTAVADRLIPDNATVGVRLPRLDREPVRALTNDEADAILDAVQGHWIERPVRVWLGSGLRRGEVLGLNQADIVDGYVRVRVSKTRVRAVPVSDDAMSALREAVLDAPRLGPSEPVFFAPRSKDRMRGDSVTHALRQIAGITPHALRHGAATLMLTGGASMRVIAEQLGHRNPALTARVYAHVVPEAQRAAVDLLERRRPD
jgi:integrase